MRYGALNFGRMGQPTQKVSPLLAPPHLTKRLVVRFLRPTIAFGGTLASLKTKRLQLLACLLLSEIPARLPPTDGVTPRVVDYSGLVLSGKGLSQPSLRRALGNPLLLGVIVSAVRLPRVC